MSERASALREIRAVTSSETLVDRYLVSNEDWPSANVDRVRAVRATGALWLRKCGAGLDLPTTTTCHRGVIYGCPGVIGGCYKTWAGFRWPRLTSMTKRGRQGQCVIAYDNMLSTASELFKQWLLKGSHTLTSLSETDFRSFTYSLFMMLLRFRQDDTRTAYSVEEMFVIRWMHVFSDISHKCSKLTTSAIGRCHWKMVKLIWSIALIALWKNWRSLHF